MNRIDEKIKSLRAQHRAILSPYITAGDPHPDLTVNLMHQLVKEGADILEIGIPFSDPMAEGPVIQQAMERALSHDVNCDTVLEMVKQFRTRDKDTPIVLMGYLNPIEQYGYASFAKSAREAGIDGTILVDLPPEENSSIMQIWDQNNLYNIYLCSPTTSPSRMSIINKFGKGYIYYVSLKGVTGSDTIDIKKVESDYCHRKAQTHLPVVVGFGIKTAETAAKIAQFADGVVVGAALISDIIAAYEKDQSADNKGPELIGKMRQAIDRVGTSL